MGVFTIVNRVAMFGITALVCIKLAHWFGPVPATLIWSVGIGLVCAALAAGIRFQPMGKVTIVNWLAGAVLPWGFRLGRGKLHFLVICSWLAWTVSGAAVIFLTSWQIHISDYHSRWMEILLLISWIVDAGLLIRLVTFVVIRAKGNPIPLSIIRPIVVLAIILVASVVVMLCGRMLPALLIAGGPILLVGAAWVLMSLYLLTVGRHERWN